MLQPRLQRLDLTPVLNTVVRKMDRKFIEHKEDFFNLDDQRRQYNFRGDSIIIVPATAAMPPLQINDLWTF